MKFCRIEGTVENIGELFSDMREHEMASRIQEATAGMFTSDKRRSYLFVSSIRRSRIVCGAIVTNDEELSEQLDALTQLTDMSILSPKIAEITMHDFDNLLRWADRTSYIRDDGEVRECYGIDGIAGNTERYMTEHLLGERGTKRQYLRETSRMLCRGTLEPELERIYLGSSGAAVKGHPVHYMIKSDEKEAAERISTLLLSALRDNGRICNRRYSEIFVGADCFFSPWNIHENILKDIYESGDGGAVVVHYNVSFDEDGRFATAEAESLEKLCDVIRNYRNRVLTVICLDRGDEHSEKQLLNLLGSCALVKLQEDIVYADTAKRYLRQLAAENGVTGSRSLYRIADDKTRAFLPSELRREFGVWLDGQLKSKVYPQYASFVSAAVETAESKATGSAYETLQEMTGLSSAKKVIDSALDYYKAQKLFADRGLKADRPAMHMAFTGSPGTAKTTVARLFARIMKENGVLSVGDLFEVGRADLVGKYVGWTAKIVKDAFAKAKGSVLFIDEAYSLVDDRAGLYGDEAINTIVQEMENHRDDVVVIFAGYTDQMNGFLARNPGLSSRIAFHVPFEDYTAEELYSISELIAKNKGLCLDSDVKGKLVPIFEQARLSGDFGNGRFARNLIESAAMKQAGRLIRGDVEHITEHEVKLLIADDFDAPENLRKEPEKRCVGF